VMFFIERAEQIGRLVNSILDSVENIAKGNLSAAIGFVERTMANALPVIIGFLARLAGLGAVTQYVRDIIGKVRGTIAGAVEKVGLWIKDKAKAVLATTKAPTAEGKQVAADPAGPDDALRERVVIAGEAHEVFTVPGSYALQMASLTPVPLPQKTVPGVAEAYADYLAAVNKADSKTAKRQIAREKLKAIIAVLKSRSNPEHPAPGIGNVAPYRDQSSRLHASDVPLWKMWAEHVVARDFVNSMYRSAGWPEVTEPEYKGMTTVLIYLGARERKDHGENADTSLLAQFRGRVVNKIGAGASAAVARRAFGFFARGAIRRTIAAVVGESQENSAARGPQGKPEPATPSDATVRQAAAIQMAEIDDMTDKRSTAAIGQGPV
jgi:hypothetical protein